VQEWLPTLRPNIVTGKTADRPNYLDRVAAFKASSIAMVNSSNERKTHSWRITHEYIKKKSKFGDPRPWCTRSVEEQRRRENA